MQTISETDTQLVRRIARRYARPNLPVQDLMQEGYIGLLRAKQHFDPTRGISFGSYAAWWVRKYILSALKEYGHIVRLPQHNACAMERCISESLDKPVSMEDDERLTYADILRDETPRADEQLTQEERKTALLSALNALPWRMQTVVRGVYGIGCERRTCAEIANELGVSHDVVKKIHHRAKKRLRECPLLRKMTY